MNYVKEFLSLSCAGDVLNAVGKIGNPDKEISESMAIINRLRDLTIKHPMEYELIELCAGHCLTSVLAVHLLPVKTATAIDIRKRSKITGVSRWQYCEKDINTPDFEAEFILNTPKKSIVVAVHPCKGLAPKVIDLWNKSKSEMLITMPCCVGEFKTPMKSFYAKQMGMDALWAAYLAEQVQGDHVYVCRDTGVLSPKNYVIVGKRK